jgi:hypothetical protein
MKQQAITTPTKKTKLLVLEVGLVPTSTSILSFYIEVKIMSIPRIAISNEDDSSLRILETRSRLNTLPSCSPPYKSIIKTRSSQPQSPSSSTTTQSFHTCLESSRKGSLDRSSDISVPRERSHTVSMMKNPTDNTLRQRPASLYRNHTFTTSIKEHHRQREVDPQRHLLNPVRRINSHQPSPRQRRSIAREDQSVNTNSIIKRRSTFDHFTYPVVVAETPSVYGTPEHQGANQHLDSAIRLVIDTDPAMQGTINDQSDMQVDATEAKTLPEHGVSVQLV